MNDLLNIDLVSDNLKEFDQAWEETLMALEKEPEVDLVEGLHHRQLEKWTLMQNALALYHSDQVHRKEPQSYSRLKALFSNVLEEQQQYSLVVKNQGDVERGDC